MPRKSSAQLPAAARLSFHRGLHVRPSNIHVELSPPGFGNVDVSASNASPSGGGGGGGNFDVGAGCRGSFTHCFIQAPHRTQFHLEGPAKQATSIDMVGGMTTKRL